MVADEDPDRRMFTVSLSVGALIYTLAACGLVFGLSFYYDWRDRNLYESQRRQTIFHCIRCDKLYAARSGTETCECPRCQFKNARLTF
jgi:hypothetical protein